MRGDQKSGKRKMESARPDAFGRGKRVVESDCEYRKNTRHQSRSALRQTRVRVGRSPE